MMKKKVYQNIIFRPCRTSTSLPFSLRSVGALVFKPYYWKKLERFQVVQAVGICFVIKGHAFTRLQRKDCPISAGEFTIILPGSEVNFYTKNSSCEVRVVTMDGEAAPAIINSLKFDLSRPMKFKKFPEKAFTELRESLTKVDEQGEIASCQLLYEFLIYLKKLIKGPVPGFKKNRHILERAVEIMENNYMDPSFGVNQLTEILSSSRETLNRNFRKESGISPKMYLNNIRLQKVLSLLKETDLTIAEISRETGFSSPNYLTKFFFKKMQITPGRFRNLEIS